MGDSQNTVIGTTIEEYLRGCVGFEVTDSAITTILIDREIAPGTEVATLEKRQKDLCRADLYMWCSRKESVTESVEDANGVWKHKEGGSQISDKDKRYFRQEANNIYALYGENVRKSSIKIFNLGMNMNKRYPL